MASTTFDLPDPFGPTTTVTPGSNWSVVGSANDLKPLRVSDFKNTAGPTLVAPTQQPPEPFPRPRQRPSLCRSGRQIPLRVRTPASPEWPYARYPTPGR